MPKHPIYRTIALILVGLALFHLIASLVAVMFWLLTGDWRNLVPQIAIIAVSLTLPLGYYIWEKYFEKKFSP